MTSSGESSVSYLCPQCQTKLTASAEHAGQRGKCPKCGKVVKVPGAHTQTSRAGQASSSGPSAASETGGIANISIVCPLCGTRMYATKKQVGQTIVCPDCLESVVVPDRAPPQKPPPQPKPDPSASSATTAPAASNASEEDEFRLADPVELPRHRSVTSKLADFIDQHVAEHEQPQNEDDAAAPPESPTAPIATPRQFAIKCPVCDTMLQATAAEIGTRKECPDCFSPIEVKRPKPKPQRVNEVKDADYEDDEFVLDAPAPLDVFTPTDQGTAPRTLGEEALRKAREQQAQRARETPDLPLAPLWTHVFTFLRDIGTITRLAVTGVLLGVTMSFAVTVVGLMTSDDPSAKFFGMAGGAFLTLLTIVTVTYASTNFLNVLQESAEGCEKIDSWPENSLAEWITESFTLLMAIFFAVIPGLVAVVTADVTGLSWQNAWLFAGLGLYAFLPITQLSILESASLANPVSKPIIDSIGNAILLWCTFYIMTFFLALLVALALASIRAEHSTFAFVALGIFLAFGGFLYFRLLGRLAWACQMRPLLKKTTQKNERSQEDPENDRDEHANG